MKKAASDIRILKYFASFLTAVLIVTSSGFAEIPQFFQKWESNRNYFPEVWFTNRLISLSPVFRDQNRAVAGKPIPGSSNYLALFRFPLGSETEAILTRQSFKGVSGVKGSEQLVTLHIYNERKKRMIQQLELALIMEEKGFSLGKESWIEDINNDGKPDILRRSWDISLNEEKGGRPGALVDDRLRLYIWNGERYSGTTLSNYLVRDYFEKYFYRHSSFPGNETSVHDSIAGWLKKNYSWDEEKNTGEWSLVLGAWTNLNDARVSKDQVVKIFDFIGDEHRYYGELKIIKKGGNYHLVMGKGLRSRRSVELTLERVKKIFGGAGFVVNIPEFFPDRVWVPAGNYFECRESPKAVVKPALVPTVK